jgi:acetolactate synthase-1/3 small subunit
MSHVISVVTEDKPGVLARVSSMFARRGFNIHSLAVGPTADPAMSQMTVVVDGPAMEQIIKQLYKLVHVVKVIELDPSDMVEREVMLLRVSTEHSSRGEILDAAAVFEAKAIDVGSSTITFELSGTPGKLSDFLELMGGYGIVELVKSGRIALPRSPKGVKNKGPRQGRLRSA